MATGSGSRKHSGWSRWMSRWMGWSHCEPRAAISGSPMLIIIDCSHERRVRQGDSRKHTRSCANQRAVISEFDTDLYGKDVRKNGAIITADYEGKELSRLSFHNALITEIGFPALDASSKDTAKMSIKITPEYTRRQANSGASLLKDRLGRTSQKQWLASNFRL